jgi:anti-anti-sigma factor
MYHVNEPLIVTNHVEHARRSLTLVPRRDSRGACVVYVEDPFRAPITGELRHRVLTLLRRGGCTIVLDLSRVSRIDAAGVGQLVRAYNVTVAANGTLQLVHATAWVRDILERVGLFDLLSGGRQPGELQ